MIHSTCTPLRSQFYLELFFNSKLNMKISLKFDFNGRTLDQMCVFIRLKFIENLMKLRRSLHTQKKLKP